MYLPRPFNFLALSIVTLFLIAPPLAHSQDEKKSNPNDAKLEQEKKISSYAELVKAYEAQNIKFEKNETAESLMFRTSKGDFKGVMVVKWDGVNGVLHLIQTWPINVPKEKRGLFLQGAQTLNHGFLFPGIGMNLSNGGAYYRLSVPVAPRGYLHDYELGTYTRFAIQKASEFMPTMQKVIDGEVKMDELILYHQKHLRSLAAKNTPTVKLAGKYSRTVEGVEWILDFSGAGTVKVFRDGKMGVESKITIKGDQCLIEDTGGPLASTHSGSYRIIASGDKLTWRAIKDPADQRKAVLSGGVWSAKK